MKEFRSQESIGKAKYLVSHHDGVKTHRDGSPFFDLAVFRNKRKRDRFVSDLKKSGYQGN